MDNREKTVWLVEPDLWSLDEQLRALREGWWLNVTFDRTVIEIAHVTNRRFLNRKEATEFYQRAVIALTKCRLHGAKEN